MNSFSINGAMALAARFSSRPRRSVFRLLAALTTCCLLLATVPAVADDMRAAARKARADHEAAQQRAKDSEKRILEDRTSLEQATARLEGEVQRLGTDITGINRELAQLTERKTALAKQQSSDDMGLREFSGSMRVVARDLEAMLVQSQLTAFTPKRLETLAPILDKNHYPDLHDVRTLAELLFQELTQSGEVTLRRGEFTNRHGQQGQGDILTIGKLAAIYKDTAESGYLQYADGSRQFQALSALPAWGIRRNLDRYLAGASEAVSMDMTGGAALRQITHTNTLTDQINKGGLLVWPILAIGVLALLMALERSVFLKGVHDNTDHVMARVNELAQQGQWRECDRIVHEKQGRPVYNVLNAGLRARGEKRETLESILQESILRELPRLERFLPMLNMMGAIAPLLGLLGTVTGMISTFHVITLYGTGDPRMMSGGISEALVTTMLGLAVAIPIMLLHTFLSRRVEHIVGDMEEKAVALTNIICRESVQGA